MRAERSRVPIGQLPRRRFVHRRPAVLTVITPTFNRADYLKETIDSVLSQGFNDLQFIVMDDGSTDETRALVQGYGEKIEYHWHENIGEQRTVNRALELARGEFFMIVNSDDPILPNCLTRMVGALTDNPAALAAYPNWQVIDPESTPVATIEVGELNITRMLTSLSVSIGPGACFRRSLLERVGYRNPLLRYSADLDYWYRIALAGEILYVAETLATHRTHPGSAVVASRGDMLAREAGYLFEAYSRHPRVPRHMRSAADAHSHFIAAFVWTDLRGATREMLRSLLANPIVFLTCLERHGIGATIKFFEELGGTISADTTVALATVSTARSRRAAYRIVARAAIRDPVGWLLAMTEAGLPRVASWVRQLPHSAATGKPKLSGHRDVRQAWKLLHRITGH